MNPSFEEKPSNPWDRKPTLPASLNNPKKKSVETEIEDAVNSIIDRPSTSNENDESLLTEVMKELVSPSLISPIRNVPKITKTTPRCEFKRTKKPCLYIIKKGLKKGTVCGTSTRGRYCAKHNKALLCSADPKKPVVYKSVDLISSSDEDETPKLPTTDPSVDITAITCKVSNEKEAIGMPSSVIILTGDNSKHAPVKPSCQRSSEEKSNLPEEAISDEINLELRPPSQNVITKQVKKLKLKNYPPTKTINKSDSTIYEHGTVNNPFKMRRSRFDPCQKYKLIKYIGKNHAIVSWRADRCYKIFLDEQLERKPLNENWYLKVQYKKGPAMWKC